MLKFEEIYDILVNFGIIICLKPACSQIIKNF